MSNGIITDVAGLIDELNRLKAADAYKFHICDDAKSFDRAIECAIEAIESYVENEQ